MGMSCRETEIIGGIIMKNNKKETINLFLSAFLIIAYIVCSYFFINFANSSSMERFKPLIYALVCAVFGLLVFYSTRVGEGKSKMRFSIATLVVLDIPALFIVLAGVINNFPLHDKISTNIAMAYIAAAALGYGIPYTFISGFESASDDSEEDESDSVLEGGIEADINEAEEDEEAPTYESDADEIVVEGDADDIVTEDDAMADSE